MRSLLFILAMFLLSETSLSQKVKNDFFALHNIIRGDSTYNTFDKQVELVKKEGYDGIEINLAESFEGMKAALDKHRFPASYFYIRVELDKPYFDTSLQNYIQRLKGSKTILCPFIVRNASFPTGSHDADTLVTRLMRQLAAWAQASGLQVAIYPHLGYYVERTGHALELAKSVDRNNLGLTFNLCHWLATTTPAGRNGLQSHLRELRPFLKMITVSGANDVLSQEQNVWNDYILPLGKGSFDTYGLIKYCIKDLSLDVPIGVQCYNIKTDKPELVRNTMRVWKKYKQMLEQGN